MDHHVAILLLITALLKLAASLNASVQLCTKHGSLHFFSVYFSSDCQHCFSLKLLHNNDCQKEELFECYANILLLAGFLNYATHFLSFESFNDLPCPYYVNKPALFFFIVTASLLTVHAAGAKVKDLEDEADRLLEKLQPIKKLQDNLRRNISQIKELINQARKQANSVSC